MINEHKRDWILIACLIILFIILIYDKHGNRTQTNNRQQVEQHADKY